MKRLWVLGFVGLSAGVLAGCPIFNDGHSGECRGGVFDDCNGAVSGGSAIATATAGPFLGCTTPADCGANETCGSNGQCDTGDCTFAGCVNGFICVIATDQTASCQPGGNGAGGATASSSTGPSTNASSTSSAGGAGGATSTSASSAGGAVTGTSVGGSGGGGPVYCGHPADCATGQTCAPNGTCEAGDCTTLGCVFGFTCDISKVCKPNSPADCGADADCAGDGAGYVCVSGTCTAPQDQCFDGSQCPGVDKCVTGKCTPACTSNTDCRDGYACDTTLGVCSKPSTPCTITNDCGGPSTVCTDGACIPRSPGGVCPTGDVWVENGCIPNQSASFICTTDGAQDVCVAGSLCLHHSCYISCEAPNQTACDQQAPPLNVCKSVTTTSGAHNVCGSTENLGTECDPTKSCAAGKICIDGFCR